MASGEVLVDRGELRPVGLDIDVDVDVENVERAEQDCWRRIFAGPVECTEVERTGSRLVGPILDSDQLLERSSCRGGGTGGTNGNSDDFP
jgi:hypothetical protein